MVKVFQRTVNCKDIKISTGYKFPYDDLPGKKKSVYHRGQKTPLAHIGYKSGEASIDKQHVASADQQAVVTHNCSDLEIHSVDDDQTPVKEFSLIYNTTDNKPTPLPPASNGTVIPQGIGGHVDSGSHIGGSGNHVGSGLAIGLSVGGILLLLLLLVIGFVIWRKKPKWFRRQRERLTCCLKKRLTCPAPREVLDEVAMGRLLPDRVVQDEAVGNNPVGVIQDGAAQDGAAQDGAAPDGRNPVKGGGAAPYPVKAGIPDVVPGGAIHGAVFPDGEAAAPDRVLGLQDEEEAMRVRNQAVPNGVVQDGVVSGGAAQEGAVPDRRNPVKGGGAAPYPVKAGITGVVPGGAVHGAVAPGGEAAAPVCVLGLKDEEEAERVPLLCDDVSRVVVTVDVPDVEPDQADRAPKGTNCRLPVSDVEAAQQLGTKE